MILAQLWPIPETMPPIQTGDADLVYALLWSICNSFILLLWLLIPLSRHWGHPIEVSLVSLTFACIGTWAWRQTFPWEWLAEGSTTAYLWLGGTLIVWLVMVAATVREVRYR